MSSVRDQRQSIEDMSHRDAAEELLGQVVRYERDRANRNRDTYSSDVKMQSSLIHSILAVEESLDRIADLLAAR